MEGIRLILDGLNKQYHDQRYPCILEVRVTFKDGDQFTDCIKGLNAGHALHNAYVNWPTASNIQIIREVNHD